MAFHGTLTAGGGWNLIPTQGGAWEVKVTFWS
jgi:hypothetical protein